MDKSNVTKLHPKEKGGKSDNLIGTSLSPREIVSELDRFVVGQNKAKKAVAVALSPVPCINESIHMSLVLKPSDRLILLIAGLSVRCLQFEMPVTRQKPGEFASVSLVLLAEKAVWLPNAREVCKSARKSLPSAVGVRSMIGVIKFVACKS